MNLVIATGRVGIVDSRNTKDGTPVTSVSVAMNERWTKDGQAVEKTTWIRFTFWRKEAEIARQILNTGDLVTLTGKLEQPSTFQNKQGQWVAALEATGQSIEKLSKKGEHGNGQAEAPVTTEAPATTQAPAATQAPATTQAPAQPELTIPLGDNGAPF